MNKRHGLHLIENPLDYEKSFDERSDLDQHFVRVPFGTRIATWFLAGRDSLRKSAWNAIAYI